MRRVWIAQCLCPDRHCLMASAGEAESREEAEAMIEHLREAIEGAIAGGWMNPWCALCKATAPNWTYEVGRTRWATMTEAMPALQANEAAQRLANAYFGDLERDD